MFFSGSLVYSILGIKRVKFFIYKVFIRLPDAQVENINYGDSAALQTGERTLVCTRDYPYIGEVEISKLSLPRFEPWSLVQTLQLQNQLSYAHSGIGERREKGGRGVRIFSKLRHKIFRLRGKETE